MPDPGHYENLKRNNMKQAAVEWYGKQIGLLFQQFQTNKINITEFHYKRLELEEQAKEMEKEQIINAINFGDERGKITTYKSAEQYYKETFKSE
jgi:hypothetical protein